MPSEHPLLSKLTRTLVLFDVKAEAARALLPVRRDQRISRKGDRSSRSFLLAEGQAGRAPRPRLYMPGWDYAYSRPFENNGEV